MSDRPPAGVVVDAMVISWLFDERPNQLADRYRELIGDAPVVLAFQTVMELRFGVLRAGWGELRRRGLDRRVAQLSVLQPDDDMITRCAPSCESIVSGSATPSPTSSTTATAGSP